MNNERIRFLVELLGAVACTAFRAADGSEERDEEGSRIHVVGYGDFDAMSKALDACDELPELGDAYVRDGWLRALDELRGLLAVPLTPWTALADGKYQDRIRYIGASDSHVLGDVYHGYGQLVVGRMAEEGYAARQGVLCWRYSASGEQVEPHLPLTHLQPLPVPPVPRPNYTPFKFSDSPDGAAAEAVYLRQVAAEDRFNGQ